MAGSNVSNDGAGGVEEPKVTSPNMVALLRRVLPKLPTMARLSVAHTLNLSETSKYLDLRTALTVAFLRGMISPDPSIQRTIRQIQKSSMTHAPTKGRLWLTRYTCPVSDETNLPAALGTAIEALNNPDVPAPRLAMAPLAPVSGEWIGYRAKAQPSDPLSKLRGKESYDEMMREVNKPTTILYLHGGGYSFMDPATHRETVKKLTKITGGRAYSVRYRLAPQSPFPAAVMDALVAYMTLLYPPPGSFHEPVKPEHIVIAGDRYVFAHRINVCLARKVGKVTDKNSLSVSAGGNLSIVLTQVIVELNRLGEKIQWHGEAREVPIPAACATNSPWVDISHSSRPYYSVAPDTFDYLSPLDGMGHIGIKANSAWPSSPSRKFLYAADDIMTHPVVSPVMRRDWTGFPPMYVCTGWERLAFEDKFLVQKFQRDGVTTVFEEYEAMPHCFGLIFAHLPEAHRCLNGWAGFISQAVDDPASLTSSATKVYAKTLKEEALEFDKLHYVEPEEYRRRVVTKVDMSKPFTAKL